MFPSKNIPRRRKFIICGHNGNSLVEKALTDKGWNLCSDEEQFHLKWTELKSQIDFEQLIEGKQLANHIPSSACITTKSGLLNSLRAYYNANCFKESPNGMSKFFPETYRLGDCREREKLLNIIGDDELWICKPTNCNQGKGIFLIKGKQELLNYIEKKKKNGKNNISSRIIQRYIASPLLIQGRKFDIRVFMLIGSTRPYNVFFHSGYLRLSVNLYDTESRDLKTHLTNQYVQKRHPNYSESKEDTVWSMEHFQNYLDGDGLSEKYNLKSNWVFTELHEKMKKIAYIVFKSAQCRLTPKVGLFDLYGLDFMLDENLNVWLLEVNTNPSMHTHCRVLADMLPCVIDETLDICIELFDKKVSGLPTFPIESSKNFDLIFSAAKEYTQESIEMPLKFSVPLISKSASVQRKKVASFKKNRTTSSLESTKRCEKILDQSTSSKNKKDDVQSVPLKLALVEVSPCPEQSSL